MAQTILSNKSSTTGSPTVKYTVNVTPSNRTLNTVDLLVSITSKLGSSSSTLGTGSGYGLKGKLTVNSQDFWFDDEPDYPTGNSPILKKRQTKWSGTTEHTVSATITVTGLAWNTESLSASFYAIRTTNSTSNAGYLATTSCNNITIDKSFAASYFTSGATSGTLGTSQNISITSYSDSFTHDLTFTIGGSTLNILNNFTTSSLSKTISWTPSYDYAANNTNGTSVSGVLSLTTNFGDGTSNTVTSTCTLTIPNNGTTQPTLSISDVDSTSLKIIYGKYVKTASRMVLSATASGKYNATISSYQYQFRKENSSGALLVNTNGSYEYTWTPSYAGNVYVSVTTTDSRGYSTTTTKTIVVADYSPPNISTFNCERDLADDTTINCYIYASTTNIDNQNTNIGAYTLKYKKSSEENYTSVSLGTGFYKDYSSTPYQITNTDSSSTYDVYLEVVDLVNQTTKKSAEIPTAFTLMNFNSNGRAMAIGKTSEATGNNELLEVAMNIKLSSGNEIYYDTTKLLDLIYPVGTRIFVSDGDSAPSFGTWTADGFTPTYTSKNASSGNIRSWLKVYKRTQ